MSYDAGRILIMPKDTWSASINYEILDTVRYQEKTYLSKVSNNLGHIPTEDDNEYWFMMAKDGAPGVGSVRILDEDLIFNPVSNG